MKALRLYSILLLLIICFPVSTFSARESDPLEPINRKIYVLNKQIDRFLLKPAAQVYKKVLPWPVRTGVNNFFENMSEVPTIINDVLQGHFIYALNDSGRLVINSTIGIAGLIDVASKTGLEKHYNDFGITLARYGITEAPYLVLPFFGPSTLRDGMALAVYYRYMTLWPYIEPVRLRNSLAVLDAINTRAQLLDAENIMEEAALDEYTFMRNAYFQLREKQIAAMTAGKNENPQANSFSDDE